MVDELAPRTPQNLFSQVQAPVVDMAPGLAPHKAGPTRPLLMPQPGQSSAAPPVDALSAPFRLPSSGLHYRAFVPGHSGEILITPMRGEHEELLGGVGDNPIARLSVLRHVTSQLFTLGGIPFPELLVQDWAGALLQFLAASAGGDTLHLSPTHADPSCKKVSKKTLKLGELPCTMLRAASAEEAANWPSQLTAAEDPDLAALRELQGGRGTTYRVLNESDTQEPFTCVVGGARIAWRYLRMRDLAAAEEFISATGATDAPGAKLNTFLLASMLVSVDGRPILGPLQAVSWVKRAPLPTLNQLRRAVLLRDFGFDMTIRFTCDHCGGSFKVTLPLDGRLFHGPDGAPAGAAG